MSDETVRPALTREQWAALVIDPELGPQIPITDGSPSLMIPFQAGDYHGLAALALHGQPFGFTREGLFALREVMANFRAFASTAGEFGNQLIAQYGDAAQREIDKIAALLPPEQP
ncbi:MAG TPA: hypothetical protein VN513_15365 [Gemmatimonadales bacterium]|nr:hypothetical protein [Gemmatimonadales bacterium]